MNTKKILMGGFAALLMGSMLTACGGSDGSNAASSLNDATEADSVLYYLGQVSAAEYWRAAERDTTLATSGARQAYLRGLRAGMNAVKGDDEHYNQGFERGIQMAMNMIEFEKTYNVKANAKIFAESLAAGLTNDSAVSPEAQGQFYQVLGRLNAKKEAADREKAAENLRNYVKKVAMQQISPDLFGRVVEKGDTARLKKGDKVYMHIVARNIAGEELDVPFPSETEVGGRYSNALCGRAMETMSSGETKEFATTALALFGGRAERLGLTPDEVVILNIKASLQPMQGEGAKAAAPQGGGQQMKAIPAENAKTNTVTPQGRMQQLPR